jgi:soluble lytic murein transglycosylase-like protein
MITKQKANHLGQMLKFLLILCLTLVSPLVFSEVYFYSGPNGERMVSDRPQDGYELTNRRDTLNEAGHILAEHPLAVASLPDIERYIESASKKYGVDPTLVTAVIQVESAFNQNAISSAGATGLMQLMSPTADQYDVKERHSPRDNINAGVKHLKHLMDEFDGDIPLVVAAYNAGASTVKKYKGIPPYPETQNYVTKVMSLHASYFQKRYGLE